jgi:Type I phosphodiesterase / nucleotide pyrophosphatase
MTKTTGNAPMIAILRVAFLFLVVHAIGGSVRSGEGESRLATRNVVLVTTDGLRWQEVFRGADASLINKEDGGVDDPDSLRREYWRETPEARREVLMPFLWKTIARRGQVFGNRDKKSLARVANGMNFSYPGYNEIFTGFVDPGIDSNEKKPNPNVSVLEWLDRKPAYHGKVAAVGSWDLFPFILNVDRSGLPVNAGWMPCAVLSPTKTERILNDLMSRSIHEWKDCRNDVFTFRVALDHVRHKRPRVFYMGLGDTDEYAHGGRYDLYLRAAHEADAAIKSIWDELQSHSQYRGTTTLIVTTDHGRGDAPLDWRTHGEKIVGSDATWLAVIGPDTPALGERSDVKALTQSQVAATLAALLGEDYKADVPRAAPPIAEVLPASPGVVREPAVPTRPADQGKASP